MMRSEKLTLTETDQNGSDRINETRRAGRARRANRAYRRAI